MAIEFKSPPISFLEADWLCDRNITLGILRLDLIHPEISGNKWYKLKENIRLAQAYQKQGILTFGGIWSNHLAATAAACQALGLKSVGVVRGYSEDNNKLTPTLRKCIEKGMHLMGVNRETYRRRYEDSFIKEWQERFPNYFLIPEGGNNEAGRAGASDLSSYVPQDTTHLALGVGTGTTLAGMLQTIDSRIQVLGFGPFRKIKQQTQAILATFHKKTESPNWQLFPDPVFGGFGRYNSQLIDFINEFYRQFHIPLDIIYTGKMMFYLKDKILNDSFPKGSHILAVHSGGLQGNASIKDKLLSALSFIIDV